MIGEIKWFLLLLTVLYVYWWVIGGPNQTENQTRPFLEQPVPIENGQPYTTQELKERNPALFHWF